MLAAGYHLVLPEGFVMSCMSCGVRERMRGRARCEECAKVADAEAKEKKKVWNSTVRVQQGYNVLMGEWAKRRLI
jgi:hypothetical protein